MRKSIKDHLRAFLYRHGWFLRRIGGLSAGVDFYTDLIGIGHIQIGCVLDVGAHRGETCRKILLNFPEATVHAFEPVKENFSVLKTAMANEPRVHVYQLALGSEAGKVEIVLQNDSQTHSLCHKGSAKETPGLRTECITVTTLDQFVCERNPGFIDLLKIDTEGFEVDVIRGGTSVFQRGGIGAVLLEASLDPNDKVHTSLLSASEALSAFGFHLVAIQDQVVWRNPLRLAYFNALFIPGE